MTSTKISAKSSTTFKTIEGRPIARSLLIFTPSLGGEESIYFSSR
jgi:hypothetical protein